MGGSTEQGAVLVVQVSLKGLKVKDLFVLDRARSNELTFQELVAFLDKVVTNPPEGGVAEMLYEDMLAVLDQLSAAMNARADPGPRGKA